MSLDCLTLIERYGLKCGCCHSCHDDHDDYGYDLCEIEIGKEKAFVCCSVMNAITPDIVSAD